MKTPPTYWKVKASLIVKEFMQAQQSWHQTDYDVYSNHIEDKSIKMKFNGGYTEYGHFSGLPELTQAQFKKHFYDPWKAGQGEPLAAKRERVVRTRTNPKRITLAKHNRITAEIQRQCDYLQSLKQADQARIAQLEADRDQQHSIIVNKEAYIKRLENDRANAMEKIELLKKDIADRTKAHTTELNYLLDSRNLWRVLAFGFAFASALLGIAQLIGGAV